MWRLWNATPLAARLTAVPVVAIGLWVAWWLGSPLFINQVVEEAFPASAPVAQPASANLPVAVIQPTSVPTVLNAPTSAPVAQSQTTRLPATTIPPAATTTPAAPTLAPTPVPATARASGPVALTSGQFGEIDAVHKGEGTATFYRLPDGQRVLRLEDFKVTNGPDLFVYLASHPDPRTSAQLHEGAAVEVARLKGNIGSQNYELPGDLDLEQFNSVIIYCKQFSVVFSTASLMTTP